MRLKSSILIALTAITLLVCPISSAYADETDNPKGFIDAIAQETGMSSSDVVATAVGILATGSGINLANNLAVNYGLDLNDNLAHLVDAADYPAWNTLDSDTKAAYGNDKTQYDAAKFNSFLEAFGLGDARNRYYGFDSSGGGNWEADWTENELDKLDVFGRIGTNWALGLSNTVQDVIGAITNPGSISGMFPSQYYTYTKTDDDTIWPSQVPDTVNYTMTQQVIAKYGNTTMYGNSTSPVYVMYLVRSSNADTIWFYNSSFAAWFDRTSNFDPTGFNGSSFTINGVTSYMQLYSQTWSTINIPTTAVNGSLTNQQMKNLVHCILTGDSSVNGGEPELIDYPDDMTGQEETETYYPEQGVNDQSSWPMFLVIRDPVIPATGDLSEVIALLRRFKFYATGELKVHDEQILTAIQNCCERFQFYASGQLKVHDEGIFDQITDLSTDLNSSLAGIQATLESILAKTGIDAGADSLIGDFDYPELEVKSHDLVEDISTLAPFGTILLLSDMVGILSQTGNIDEPELTFDFNFMPGESFDVVINLSWLDPLKPVINVLLITTLLFTLAGVTLRFVELEAAA